MFTADKDFDVIMITEMIPKAQKNGIHPTLLEIDGYIMYSNFDPEDIDLGVSGKRGVAIFIKDSIEASEVKIGNSPCKDHLWIEIPLKGKDPTVWLCI